MSVQEPVHGIGAFKVRTVDFDAPWAWLAAGWRDLWVSPILSLVYGLAYAVAAGLMVWGLTEVNAAALIFTLAGGFMLVGPIAAVGLYEKSRRLSVGETINVTDILFVRTASPVQLGFLGMLLMLVLLVWVRLATLLFALTFGMMDFPPVEQFVPTLFFTANGLTLLIVGTVIGGILATLVFALTVVSVPLLMHRHTDTLTAIATSFQAVIQNPRPMALWAVLIVGIMACGMALFFVGLVVTLPLVGHASWHAYRALVED